MYLLKWINDNDGDFFATANDMDEARKLAHDAYATGQIDDADTVQVFNAEDSGEYYSEPVEEWTAANA